MRRLGAELALAAVGGEERAEALEHLAGCESCRCAIGEFAQVVDELLLLAPREQPPAGFESRVLARLRQARRPPRRRQLAVLAAASLAAAALTAALLAPFHDGREPASEYRGTPAEADGKHLRAARLYGAGKVPRGAAFGYQGSPSWVFVTVRRPSRSGLYRCELVTITGRRITLGVFKLDPRRRSWGASIPVDLDEVAGIRLGQAGRGEVLKANFRRE